MEILRIGKQAVKVTLSEQEAIKYNISENNQLSEDEIKESFTQLLKEIKLKADFAYSNKKLFTEIFPSKNGGCEIYISCINTEANKGVYKDKISETDVKKKSLPSIYEFDCLEKLLAVVYRLNEIKHKEKTSVFYDDDRKKYFLVLENINFKALKYAFLLEYAKYVKSSSVAYLNEHYACIIKNDTVKILSALT